MSSMSSQITEQLRGVFATPDHRIEIGRAALVIAQLEYPELDVEVWLEKLERFAMEAKERLGEEVDPRRIIEILNGYVFDHLGFHGNHDDYYDPRNSFLNDVIQRRAGIPITLSVIYLEITRKLNLPFYGVGLPGHFVLKYDDGRQVHYLDPFRRGRALSEEDCQEMVHSVRGHDAVLREHSFRGVDNRYMVVRMLNNLLAIYLRRRRLAKAVGVLDMILALVPAAANEVKQRGRLNYELRRWSRAREDFETYLTLQPDAADAAEVRKWIRRTWRHQTALN